jgi:Tol biopolymer transport system component
MKPYLSRNAIYSLVCIFLILFGCTSIDEVENVFFSDYCEDRDYLLRIEDLSESPVLISRSNRIIPVQVSPNGSQLLLYVYDGQGVVPYNRGYDISIYDIASDSMFTVSQGFNARWSPDGSMITYTMKDPDSRSHNVFGYSVSEGSSVLIVEDVDRYGVPTISPDGSRMLFKTSKRLFFSYGSEEVGSLHVLDLPSGQVRLLSLWVSPNFWTHLMAEISLTD